jgi:hypothetical protein
LHESVFKHERGDDGDTAKRECRMLP